MEHWLASRMQPGIFAAGDVTDVPEKQIIIAAGEGSQATLGVFWYLLSPLAMFLILLSLRGLTNKNPIEYYPIYLLLGLIVFNLFRYATTISTNAIRGNAGLIKSLKINLEPFVISGIMQAVFSHIFEVIILVLFLFYFKVSLLCILFYPVVLFFLIIFPNY